MVGSVIEGKYRLQRELGAGGMGLVYLARHETIERSVAIKVLHKKLADDEAVRRRFETEAKAIARLRHPNCVMLYEFGFSETLDALFAVFEYVEGTSLESCVGEPLPITDALEVARQVADGIAHAHENKIIHRDLKPENIMVVPRAGRLEVKVLDFGIARIAEDDEKRTRLTQVGEMFGTPPYMSPEQVRAKLNVTAATDIYAIGIILYEMLEGTLPFLGDTPIETVMMHLNDEVPPFTRQGIPEALQEIVAQCLAKDAEDRFDSCNDLLAALNAVDATGGEPSILASMAAASDEQESSTAGADQERDKEIASAPTMLDHGGGAAEQKTEVASTDDSDSISANGDASDTDVALQPESDLGPTQDQEQQRISTIAPGHSSDRVVLVAVLALFVLVLVGGVGLLVFLTSEDDSVVAGDEEAAQAYQPSSDELVAAEEQVDELADQGAEEYDEEVDEEADEEAGEEAGDEASTSEEERASREGEEAGDEAGDEASTSEEERASREGEEDRDADEEGEQRRGAAPGPTGSSSDEEPTPAPTPTPQPDTQPTSQPESDQDDEADESERRPDGIRLDRRRRGAQEEEQEEQDDAEEELDEPAGIGLPPRD